MTKSTAARVLLVACLAGGCATPGDEPWGTAGTWVGTITTEGNVTTVINESGSVWGGTATLVEEASIGVEAGDDEYMFGSVADVWMHDDQIYVVDFRIPAVRVFDEGGVFLRQIGREGEGPGEYQAPNSVVVASDGRIFVREGRPGQRTQVYDADGAPIDTWYGDPTLGAGAPMVITFDDVVYSQTFVDRNGVNRAAQYGMAKLAASWSAGDSLRFPHFDYERATVPFDRGFTNPPFSPGVAVAMAPSGAMIAGVTNAYRFEIHGPSGFTTIVEKSWEPVAIQDEEWEWYRRSVVAQGRRWGADWTWDGAGMPRVKPALSSLRPDRSGRIWVSRIGPGAHVDDCTEEPELNPQERYVACWVSERQIDVFEEAGRYLGDVRLPDGLRFPSATYIEGDRVLGVVEDEAGTIMVKRYRLVLPGEEGS